MKVKTKKKIKIKAKLNAIERRYCSCLISVRSKKIKSPYGICTSSVYNKKKKKRKKRVPCGPNYNFNNFSINELRSYAREKKLLKKNMTKKGIISVLKKKY